MPMSYRGTRPSPIAARMVYEFRPDTQQFISEQVANPIAVTEISGTLPKLRRESTMPRDEDFQRQPGAAFARGALDSEGITYECVYYGAEHAIPVEQQALYAREIDLVTAGLQQVRGKLFYKLEKLVADLLFNATTWTGATLYTDNSGASDKWNDSTNTGIPLQIAEAKEKVRALTGLEPNALIVSKKNYDRLTQNAEIKDMLSGVAVPTADAIRQRLAAILDIERIIVGRAVYNTANPGASLSVSDVWSETYAMVARVATTNNAAEPCVARVVRYESAPQVDMRFKTYFEDQTNSTIVQGEMAHDEVVIDSAYAHLMKVYA